MLARLRVRHRQKASERKTGSQMDCQLIHDRPAVTKKPPVCGAKVRQAWLFRWAAGETVLGAATIAPFEHVTLAAIVRQRVALAFSKLEHFWSSHQFTQRSLAQAADPVTGIHEVVTGVEATVVLQYGHVTARLAEYAQRMRQAHCRSQRFIEELHDNSTEITLDPGVKDYAQKFTERLGRRGTRADATWSVAL